MSQLHCSTLPHAPYLNVFVVVHSQTHIGRSVCLFGRRIFPLTVSVVSHTSVGLSSVSKRLVRAYILPRFVCTVVSFLSQHCKSHRLHYHSHSANALEFALTDSVLEHVSLCVYVCLHTGELETEKVSIMITTRLMMAC